jgi:hypothetical protein
MMDALRLAVGTLTLVLVAGVRRPAVTLRAE